MEEHTPVLFTGDDTERSDLPPSQPTPAMFSPEDVSTVPVPGLLQHLQNSGVTFLKVHQNTWQVDGLTTRLTKQFSVSFKVDTICTSTDIIEAFDKAGVDIDDITSIQYRNSDRSWTVSFRTLTSKNQAMDIPSLCICGCEVFIGDHKTVLVKIYEAPQEMPNTIVIGRLSAYGRVLSFRRDKLSSGIFNGVRTAKMRLKYDVPSSIRVAGEMLKTYYTSQPKTCRRCGEEGLFANTCRGTRCYNCETSGHTYTTCPEKIFCGICLSSKHTIADCPYLLYSANVDPSNNMQAPRGSTSSTKEQ